VKNGSFTITSHQFVAGFHLTLGPGAESPCGTGKITVTVSGQQRLIWNPLSDLGNPSNEYAISSPTDVINPVNVTVSVNGKRQAGQLEIAFGPGTKGGAHTGGDLYYNAGNCDIGFGVKKG
jgi:hypothetical protein